MIDSDLRKYVGIIKAYTIMLAIVCVPDIIMSIVLDKVEELYMNQVLPTIQCGLMTLLCVLIVYTEKAKLDLKKLQIILMIATVIAFIGYYSNIVRQLFVMGKSWLFSFLIFPIIIIAWIISFKYNKSNAKKNIQNATATQTSIISTVAAATLLFSRKHLKGSSPEQFAHIDLIAAIAFMIFTVYVYSFVVVKIKNIEEENKDNCYYK